MTDLGDIASAVANHGEARKTECGMSQFLTLGLPTTVGVMGKGTIERCGDDALRILSCSLLKYSEVRLGPVPVAGGDLDPSHQCSTKCLINQPSSEDMS